MKSNRNWLLQLPQPRIGRYFVKVALVALAYYVIGKIATSIPGVNNLASSVWPGAGIAQASLLLLGKKGWVGLFLGAFFLNLIDLKQSLLFASIGAAGATLQALCAVFLLWRAKFHPALNRLTDVVKLIFLGGFVATQISCTLGTLALCIDGLRPWADYWQTRWEWFLGDSIGVLTFAPLLLVFSQTNASQYRLYIQQEKNLKYRVLAFIWLTLLILVSWVVFCSKTEAAISRYPLEYIPFPLIIWAAIQLSQRSVVFASVLVSGIAIWGGSQGSGPFVAKAENLNQAILFLQAFMGLMTTTALLLSATVVERSLAEQSLRQSEAKYRELIENANTIILKIDPQGYITFFNEYAQKFFGYKEEEILGQNIVGTILPAADMAGKNLDEMMRDILKYPEHYSCNENENICCNGRRVWVSWANKPLVNSRGKMIGILSIGTDITARRQAEIALQKLNEELEIRVEKRTKALQESEAKNRVLLQAFPDLIMQISGDGIYLDFVEAENIDLIVNTQERLGKSVYEILPLTLAEQYMHFIQTALQTDTIQTFEYQLQLNKKISDYEARVVPMTETSVLLTVRDVTQKKQMERALFIEQEKSEKLLLNILPEAIAARLKQGASTIADTFAEATVLFADIVGFTQISAEISPGELVCFLNEIFSAFDELADKHNLEKIKTIGDAYMVVGGLPTHRGDHAEAIAEMALDMQQKIAQFNHYYDKTLNIRIGINSGPVVAGVIGIKKFIYDLWGDTVNTASRMESQGLPGYIQVTAMTYEILRHKYIFEHRGILEVKGKGEMTTYFLHGRKM